ncbi:acyltransferase [Enterococcus casseliflavus]|uniref:acyltransferase n=1 Tax=Enterococcus casseliflavus TaxID=37734 RepID=UPI003DA3C0C0
MRGRDKFEKYERVIHIFSGLTRILPLKLRLFLLQLVRSWKGKIGITIRYILLSTVAKKIGSNVVIYEDVYLYHPNNITFGNNVSIHPNSYIQASGDLSIGSDVSIAHNVTIMTETHQYSSLNSNIKDQPMDRRAIDIRDNVWIGAKSTILLGTTILSGAIIGAHSLVNRDVEANEIVGGTPIKTLKRRG